MRWFGSRDVDRAFRRHGDVVRVVELSVAAPQRSPRAEEIADGSEVLDAVIVEIGDVDRAVRGDSPAPRRWNWPSPPPVPTSRRSTPRRTRRRTRPSPRRTRSRTRRWRGSPSRGRGRRTHYRSCRSLRDRIGRPSGCRCCPGSNRLPPGRRTHSEAGTLGVGVVRIVVADLTPLALPVGAALAKEEVAVIVEMGLDRRFGDRDLVEGLGCLHGGKWRFSPSPCRRPGPSAVVYSGPCPSWAWRSPPRQRRPRGRRARQARRDGSILVRGLGRSVSIDDRPPWPPYYSSASRTMPAVWSYSPARSAPTAGRSGPEAAHGHLNPGASLDRRLLSSLRPRHAPLGRRSGPRPGGTGSPTASPISRPELTG